MCPPCPRPCVHHVPGTYTGRHGRQRWVFARTAFPARRVRSAYGNQRCRPCRPAGGPPVVPCALADREHSFRMATHNSSSKKAGRTTRPAFFLLRGVSMKAIVLFVSCVLAVSAEAACTLNLQKEDLGRGERWELSWDKV